MTHADHVALLRVAGHRHFSIADLPLRRREAFKHATEREDRAVIMELGRADLYVEGIMGCMSL